MPDLFISYSRKDKDFVRRLDESLKSRGREAWVDWEDIRPTEDFMQAIYSAIEGVDTFVFVLTPDSVASVVCGREIAHAVAHNKRMVPVVARDVNADTVHEALAKLNWIFCRESDDFEKATDTLITAFDTDLEWIRAHTRLLTRAIEWENKGKNNSFVLRGDDLRAAEQWLAQAPTKKEAKPTALQTEYINASRKAATRRQRITLGAVSLALLVAIVLFVLAIYQRNIAEDRRRVAEARQLEAEARVALDSSREGLQKSALLAVESLKKAWTIEGYIACTRAINILPLRPKNIRPAHKKKVLALAYSANGRWLASEDADANLAIWDTIAKKQFTPETPLSHSMFYAGLAFSPDSKWLVSTNGRDALVWNTETWQQVRKLRHGDMVWSVAFSPVGDLLATASYHSSEVKLYRTSTWEEIAPSDELAKEQLTEKQNGGSWVRAAAFSQNGQWLARAGDSIAIWDMTTGKKLYRTENFKARSLAFSPDNQTLIAGGEAGGLTRVILDEGMKAEAFAEQTAQLRGVEFSGDGRYLVSASGDPASASEVVTNGVVRVWDVKSKHELLRFPREAVAAIFAPNGNAVVTGNADGTLAEWPIARVTAVKVLQYASVVKAVAFSPDGHFLVTGSTDGSIRIHNTEVGRWSHIATKALGAEVSTLAFSPDGRWLAAIAEDSLHLYSIPGWMEAFPQLGFPEESVDAVSFSPDGKWIAIRTYWGRYGSMKTTRVFELATRGPVAWVNQQPAHELPDGEPTSGGDLKLADNAESWAVMRLGGKSARSSDGRWQTVWKSGLTTLADAQLQRGADIVQHDGMVTDAAFSPNGRWLATASEDHTVRIWPLWAEDLLPLARLRLQRNLTYDEWRQAFENEPYSKTCPDLPIDPSFVDAGRKLADKGDVKGATAIFRRAMELQPDLKLDPKAEAQRLAEDAKRANAAKIIEQQREK